MKALDVLKRLEEQIDQYDEVYNVPLWGTFERHDSTHWFEVIGNIYEHKNLLEEANDTK